MTIAPPPCDDAAREASDEREAWDDVITSAEEEEPYKGWGGLALGAGCWGKGEAAGEAKTRRWGGEGAKAGSDDGGGGRRGGGG